MTTKTDSENIFERFWEKVEKTDTCWNWIGCLSSGYGQLQYNRKMTGAHRISYEWHKGPIPEGLHIDHLCRNRACVNPDHLEPVTQQENILRGVGTAAFNAKKTHCPQGHPYDGDNLYLHSNNKRGCKRCRRESTKKWERKRRELCG